MRTTIEPIDSIEILGHFEKEIFIPHEDFESWLQRHDWTYHQLARKEFPDEYDNLTNFQIGCIMADRVLWCQFFLKEPTDPNYQEPFNLFGYQKESLRYDGPTIHKCGSGVGKTREIIVYGLHAAYTVNGGVGLIGAPQQTHLDEIIDGMYTQIDLNPVMKKSLVKWKKHPHHKFIFSNRFQLYFRPSGHDGEAYRGVHARTFAIKDEAAKDKNYKQWSEFWRSVKHTCVPKIYSVPDGDRSCEFYKLSQRALINIDESGTIEERRETRDERRETKEERRETRDERRETKEERRETREERRETSLVLPPSSFVPPPSSFVPPPSSLIPHKETEVLDDPIVSTAKHIQHIKFRLFKFPKTIMPEPHWSPVEKRKAVEEFGGEDSPGYKHNILAEDGDPESSVFPWEQFRYCIKEIPEYRCLKILVESGSNEVIVTGYKYGYANGDTGPVPVATCLIDTVYPKRGFFDYNLIPLLGGDSGVGSSPLERGDPGVGSSPLGRGVGVGKSEIRNTSPNVLIGDPQFKMSDSEFRKLIKSFFLAVPGQKRGGADFGFAGDPTEIIVKNIIGKTERIVARLQLKHVTYDQQCQALDALDDIYGPQETISWGTDFGNAGSAVAHDLQGLPQYADKNYDDRLKGFNFESNTDNVAEDGDPIIDAKTGEPSKITLKELATDHMTKRMQQLDTEYPPDPDYLLYYPNHTCSNKGKHRIFKKEDDHLIDAERAEKLAKILGNVREDIFV